MKYALQFVFLALLLQACNGNFPKDPEQTLSKIQNDTLRVGYSENLPWVIKTGQEPAGLEADLLKAFARTIPTTIKWENDTEQNLMEKLEKNELHLVVAGITKDNPWKKKISFTRPYAKQGKKKHVMAVIHGENAFVLKLEEFLYSQEEEVKKRLKP